ncbi:Ku protein [Streptomyces gobiensis]|uniref:non-homologous end joining protein Ku n=1 Tax=Streptomyces gobiensis TaxID=2875706 RepID=UPI001E589E20|nr:Ku protein [Streptomyces gobiensis]UGY94891.1 Ku protein [Streptomyces gobiensis]
MRSTWKGSISFGLVNIPVQLYTATQEHDIPLHQVHEKDGSRVRMRRFCEAEDKEIPYEEITKGYEAPDGTTVKLTDEDLAELPVPSKKVIDVLAFVDADTIDPLMFSKPYYVGVADRSASKPYALLREALSESGQIAVTKIAMRTRESLAVLRVVGDTLVLQTCLWPDEVRPISDIAPEEDVAVRPQELKMARSLMETLSEDFDLTELHDEYQEALRQVLEARLQGVEPPHAEEVPAAGGKVIDLMAALEKSVEDAKTSRGEQAPAKKTAKKAAGSKKSSTAKTAKSTAKKTTAKKKAPAKKSAGRRTAS